MDEDRNQDFTKGWEGWEQWEKKFLRVNITGKLNRKFYIKYIIREVEICVWKQTVK